LGTVTIVSSELRNKIERRETVTRLEDLAIRGAVQQAITRISSLCKINDPCRLHYLFWNVFRSCCKREEVHCDGCPPDCSLPARYVPLAIDDTGRRRCPFATACYAATHPLNRQLIEHLVPHSYDYH